MTSKTNAQTAHPPKSSKFSFDEVVKRATDLAAAPFEEKPPTLPDEINKLDWDHWRQIEFKDSKALLGGNGSQFRLELFHLGHLFKRPVVINTVRDGFATPVPYQSSEFNYGPTKFSKAMPVNLGFAGFRVRTPLNDPRRFDEFLSFVGASYFRFLGRGQSYGLSARGLALANGTNQEEFPFFREFWIEAPKPEINELTIYALLDSSVVTGAYRFQVYPKDDSVIDVDVTLVPRRNGVKLGFMPLTSMFFVGENDHRFCDDWRPEMHDSDGLMMHTGSGEWIWRPLRNPTIAKLSSFTDRDAQGFGLLQRDRQFDHYNDIGLAYQLRPSYWVTPKTKLGEGRVELFEMPTTDETNDNIVATWVAKDDITTGRPLSYAYSITSALELRNLFSHGTARATFQMAARTLGTSEPYIPTQRRFMIDFVGGDLDFYRDEPGKVEVEASVHGGKLVRSSCEFNPYTAGFRATLDVEVPAGQTADLRAYLKLGPNALTETWTFPWEAPKEAGK